ncbi:hypothetical protein CTI12_AA480710 [Artemisia annua]|uniref:Uncharacterized protein n=1 Tax=Artemisia annua TaxID=35608 RepID=A0A2U1LKB1_ARTAN|nr:hypothetical protein CTI12_AA480710 [Artemisia annua]
MGGCFFSARCGTVEGPQPFGDIYREDFSMKTLKDDFNIVVDLPPHCNHFISKKKVVCYNGTGELWQTIKNWTNIKFSVLIFR